MPSCMLKHCRRHTFAAAVLLRFGACQASVPSLEIDDNVGMVQRIKQMNSWDDFGNNRWTDELAAGQDGTSSGVVGSGPSANAASEKADTTVAWENLGEQLGPGTCVDSQGKAFNSWFAWGLSLDDCMKECLNLFTCHSFDFTPEDGNCELRFNAGKMPPKPPSGAFKVADKFDGGDGSGGVGGVMRMGATDTRQCWRKRREPIPTEDPSPEIPPVPEYITNWIPAPATSSGGGASSLASSADREVLAASKSASHFERDVKKLKEEVIKAAEDMVNAGAAKAAVANTAAHQVAEGILKIARVDGEDASRMLEKQLSAAEEVVDRVMGGLRATGPSAKE